MVKATAPQFAEATALYFTVGSVDVTAHRYKIYPPTSRSR
jgi:hypothetical protein